MITNVKIIGTHCQSCKALLEEVCLEVPGVKKCTVNFETGETAVEHDESVDWSKFRQAVASLGGQYRVEEPK